jgi:hypothetical protein
MFRRNIVPCHWVVGAQCFGRMVVPLASVECPVKMGPPHCTEMLGINHPVKHHIIQKNTELRGVLCWLTEQKIRNIKVLFILMSLPEIVRVLLVSVLSCTCILDKYVEFLCFIYASFCKFLDVWSVQYEYFS